MYAASQYRRFRRISARANIMPPETAALVTLNRHRPIHEAA
jgi:hypothetical protein